jgi:LAO/AO transport system kinase
VRKGVPDTRDGLPAASPLVKDVPKRRAPTVSEYVEGILSGDRTLLSRAITLVESNSVEHFETAQAVLHAVLPRTGGALRVGVTGVPGAGKSTFIEALGKRLTAVGRKVAVTAVDPTSQLSGGSVLGDKTRMERLSVDPSAFVRPSPTGGALGGVTRKTRETILLFEAAGYDVVLVETVGVGQSEVTVRSMVDVFLLLLVAGAGDELQGLKKGIVEVADLVLVNKADGPNVTAALAAKSEYEHALRHVRPATHGWRTPVLTVSAVTGEGIDTAWSAVEEHHRQTLESGALGERRREQEREWFRELVDRHLREAFLADTRVKVLMPALEEDVVQGRVPAASAARTLMNAFREPGLPGTKP